MECIGKIIGELLGILIVACLESVADNAGCQRRDEPSESALAIQQRTAIEVEGYTGDWYSHYPCQTSLKIFREGNLVLYEMRPAHGGVYRGPVSADSASISLLNGMGRLYKKSRDSEILLHGVTKEIRGWEDMSDCHAQPVQFYRDQRTDM
jgi:hypothetical protein